MSLAKTARLLDLLAYLLQHRYPVTREEIFSHVKAYLPEGEESSATQRESARRMFERDKDELRELGIDIETTTLSDVASGEPGQGYRLRPAGFYLPYIELAEGQAHAPVRAYPAVRQLQLTASELAMLDRATQRVASRSELYLAEAARSVRRKLEFDIPLSPTEIERTLSRPISSPAQEALEVLQRAVTQHLAVRCLYYSIRRDDESEREIEPYGLFFTWGRWYVVARARDRDAIRVFRVDRMSQAELLRGPQASFTVPEDFSLQTYIHRAPWQLGPAPGVLVRVRFRFPESRAVLAQRVGTPVEPILDDGGAVIDFDVREPNSFLRWLLTFRDQATVVDPISMATELRELRERVLALYTRGRGT